MPLGKCVTMLPELVQFSTMSHDNVGREMGVLRTVNSRPRLRVAAPFRLNKMNPVAYGPRMSLTIWSFVVARYAVGRVRGGHSETRARHRPRRTACTRVSAREIGRAHV